MPEVIIVGSGTGVPSLKRASPAVLIKTHQTNILLDSGPGTLRELLRTNVHYAQLDIILYTHFHPDHISDLIHFLFAAKYEPAFSREMPVFVGGPPGFLNLYGRLRGVFGHWVEPPKQKVSLFEIGPQGAWIYDQDIKVTAFKTTHTEESQGYLLEVSNKKIAYTGDTDYDEHLTEYFQKADLLICEASFPESHKVEGHLTPVLAGQLAAQARVKALVLTHIYPECDQTDILNACRKVYQGPLFVGSDGLCIFV